MTDTFQRATRENMDRAIDLMRRSGCHAHIPLFEAVRAGTLALVYVTDRTAPVSIGELKRMGKPVVVLIGDDDGQATGPAGWSCAVPVARWARTGLIHGAGAEAAHYRVAVAGAAAHRRLMLVETESRFIAQWAGLLAPTPMLIIAPVDGAHPVQSRGAQH